MRSGRLAPGITVAEAGWASENCSASALMGNVVALRDCHDALDLGDNLRGCPLILRRAEAQRGVQQAVRDPLMFLSCFSHVSLMFLSESWSVGFLIFELASVAQGAMRQSVTRDRADPSVNVGESW
jgi:hypothetical protein